MSNVKFSLWKFFTVWKVCYLLLILPVFQKWSNFTMENNFPETIFVILLSWSRRSVSWVQTNMLFQWAILTLHLFWFAVHDVNRLFFFHRGNFNLQYINVLICEDGQVIQTHLSWFCVQNKNLAFLLLLMCSRMISSNLFCKISANSSLWQFISFYINPPVVSILTECCCLRAVCVSSHCLTSTFSLFFLHLGWLSITVYIKLAGVRY